MGGLKHAGMSAAPSLPAWPVLCPHPSPDQSHNRAAFGFVLSEVRGHGGQVGPTGHVWNPLVATGGFAAFDIFVVLVDACERGHVENVSDTVLWLLRRALDVGRRDLLGHAGALKDAGRRSNTAAAATGGFLRLEISKRWFRDLYLICAPGRRRRASVGGWKAPPACSGQCAGLTCIQLAASLCWDRIPEFPLSTVGKKTQNLWVMPSSGLPLSRRPITPFHHPT